MKKLSLLFVVMSIVCLLAAGDVLARGGGGRGGGGGSRGGGGGGGSRSSSVSRAPSVSRTSPSVSRPSAPAAPSVSRPSAPAARPSTPSVSRPSTPAAGRPSAGTRPSSKDLSNFLDVPKASTGAVGGAGAGAAGGAAAAFLQGGGAEGRPAAGKVAGAEKLAGGEQRPGGERAEARTERRGEMAANRPERVENRQEMRQNRVDRRGEILDQVNDHPIRAFWSDHPLWGAWAITRPFRWATWGSLTGWVNYGWSDPTAYSYGDNVYYQDDSVYYGDQAVATAEEYAEQAEQIAASAPDVAPDKAEWMPLGVFALTPDGQKSGPEPTLFLQLAISKEGIIAGTLNNSATSQTQTIEGMADKKTQRCAWTVAGKSRPIMETGIVNLTENTAPALVHFEDGQTQQWLMVRLEEPK